MSLVKLMCFVLYCGLLCLLLFFFFYKVDLVSVFGGAISVLCC